MQAKQQANAAEAQEQGARDAQRLAEMNAMAQEREAGQMADNMRAGQEQEEAANRARAAASGVSSNDLGSFGIYMDEQKETNREQLAWLKESGSSQVDILRAQGDSAYNIGMSNASTTRAGIGSTVASGVSSVYGTARSAGWLST